MIRLFQKFSPKNLFTLYWNWKISFPDIRLLVKVSIYFPTHYHRHWFRKYRKQLQFDWIVSGCSSKCTIFKWKIYEWRRHNFFLKARSQLLYWINKTNISKIWFRYCTNKNVGFDSTKHGSLEKKLSQYQNFAQFSQV